MAKRLERMRKASRLKETEWAEQTVASVFPDWVFYRKRKQTKSFIEYYCEIWIPIYTAGENVVWMLNYLNMIAIALLLKWNTFFLENTLNKVLKNLGEFHNFLNTDKEYMGLFFVFFSTFLILQIIWK